jgi:hypothetical protein
MAAVAAYHGGSTNAAPHGPPLLPPPRQQQSKEAQLLGHLVGDIERELSATARAQARARGAVTERCDSAERKAADGAQHVEHRLRERGHAVDALLSEMGALRAEVDALRAARQTASEHSRTPTRFVDYPSLERRAKSCEVTGARLERASSEIEAGAGASLVRVLEAGASTRESTQRLLEGCWGQAQVQLDVFAAVVLREVGAQLARSDGNLRGISVEMAALQKHLARCSHAHAQPTRSSDNRQR